MSPQVLLVAGKEEGPITAWDVDTGSALTSYKTNTCPVNGLSRLGRDHLLACQSTKSSIHAWTWGKDQVTVRSYAPEPLRCLAASACGQYVAAGGATGTIHVWSAPTGRLLRSWHAHYKAVAALAWTVDASVLLSGGSDGVVSAWATAEALDPSTPPGQTLEPWYSWASHTLGVTALVLDARDSMLLSAGLDRGLVAVTLAAGGGVLARWTLPTPIHALAMDPGAHAAYAGGANGTLYEVVLAGGQQGQQHATLEGHTLPVASLAFAGADAGTLVSGSEDGSVRFWDLRTRQQTRVLESPAKGPVTNVLVLDRPPAMQILGSRGKQQSSKGPSRLQPLAVLSKFAGAAGAVRAWEDALVVLDGTAQDDQDSEEERAQTLGWHGAQAEAERSELRAPRGDDSAPEGTASDQGVAAATHIQALQEENARLKTQLEQALEAIEKAVALHEPRQQATSDSAA